MKGTSISKGGNLGASEGHLPQLPDVYYTINKGQKPLSYKLCAVTLVFADVFVDMFNAMSIWLTVLLAFMRYRCLQSPFSVKCVHKHRRVALYVVMIVFLELCVHIPSLFLVEYVPIVMASNNTDDPYIAGGIRFQETVLSRRTHIWTETLIDSLIPSLVLLFLTWKILLTLR